jgi:hypothetical protein
VGRFLSALGSAFLVFGAAIAAYYGIIDGLWSHAVRDTGGTAVMGGAMVLALLGGLLFFLAYPRERKQELPTVVRAIPLVLVRQVRRRDPDPQGK